MLFTLISQSPGKSPGKRLKEPEVPEAQIIPRTFLTGLESKKKKKKKINFCQLYGLKRLRE